MAICAYILKIVEKDPFLRLQMRARAFQDYYICHFLMRVTFIHCCLSSSLLEQAFRRRCLDPLVSSNADRWVYKPTRCFVSLVVAGGGALHWLF